MGIEHETNLDKAPGFNPVVGVTAAVARMSDDQFAHLDAVIAEFKAALSGSSSIVAAWKQRAAEAEMETARDLPKDVTAKAEDGRDHKKDVGPDHMATVAVGYELHMRAQVAEAAEAAGVTVSATGNVAELGDMLKALKSAGSSDLQNSPVKEFSQLAAAASSFDNGQLFSFSPTSIGLAEQRGQETSVQV